MISEQNKVFKLETKEKMGIVEESLRVCRENTKIIQRSQDYNVALILKEFATLREELAVREKLMVESVNQTIETEMKEIEAHTTNLEFLKGCFKDASEVDPFQSYELGVHFFAVFDLLKKSTKNYRVQSEPLSFESLNLVEFFAKSEMQSLLTNYGKIKTFAPKKRTVSPLADLSPQASPLSNRLRDFNSNSQGARGQNLPQALSKSHQQMSRSNSSDKSFTRSNQRQEPLKIRQEQARRSLPEKNLSHYPREKYVPGSIKLNCHKREQSQPPRRSQSQSYHDKRHISRKKPVTATSKSSAESLPTEEKEIIDFAVASDQNPYASFLTNVLPPANQRVSENVDDQDNNALDTVSYQLTTYENGSHPEEETSTTQIIDTEYTKGREVLDDLFLLQDSVLAEADLRSPLLQLLPREAQCTQLLYRLSRDGADSRTFHKKVDGQSPLLVIIKANSDYIFGYYLPLNITSCEKYNACENCFIFSLKNPLFDKPMIFPIRKDKKFIALYQSCKSPCLGSTLHNKQDLWLQ